MTASKSHPRKRLFVNRAIQGRMLARTALYWMLYHGVLWMSMFFYRYAEHRGAVQAGAAPRSFNDLYGEFTRNHLSLWVCAIAILPLVLWDLLAFSHRIVGPLVRFQRTLERMSAGEEISQVHLRKGDLLHDLQGSFNEYLATLQTMQSQAESDTRGQSTNDSLADDLSKADSLEATIAFDLQQLQAEVSSSLANSSAKTPETAAT